MNIAALSDYITMENFILAYPWLLNSLSLTCAYLLANSRVVPGRMLGAFAAVNWMLFGFLTEQYAFTVANVAFFYIYASAVLKFRKKRDSYKATFEEQEAEIQALQRQLERRTRRAEKRLAERERNAEKKLAERERRIERHARQAAISLQAIMDLSNNTGPISEKQIIDIKPTLETNDDNHKPVH